MRNDPPTTSKQEKFFLWVTLIIYYNNKDLSYLPYMESFLTREWGLSTNVVYSYPREGRSLKIMKFVIYEVLLTSIGLCNLLVAGAVLNLCACVCMGGFCFSTVYTWI